jgi:hypothetical protein
MNYWSVLVSIGAGVVIIVTGIWAIVKWWHAQIVDAVSDKLKSIDDAVNHRKEGEPRLIEMVEDILSETRDMRVDLERLNTKVERHLGWHEGVSRTA